MKRILALDDDPVNNHIMEYYLCKAGFEVITVNNTQAALHLIEQEVFDLLISDFVLQEMNGVDLMNILLNRFGSDRIKVVFFSSEDDRAVRQKVLELGAVAWISKPYTNTYFIKRITSLLQN